VFVSLIEKHLNGLVGYNVPEAGMFVYFKLLGIPDSKKLVGGSRTAMRAHMDCMAREVALFEYMRLSSPSVLL
jgi:DNA-binding transcriptional MocR family regulator